MALQSRKRTGGAGAQPIKARELAGVETPAVDSVLQMILTLGQRAARNIQESGKICVGPTSEGLGDVPRCRAAALLI